MKLKNEIVKLVIGMIFALSLTSCSFDNEEDKEGKKVTNYEEYTLVVASQKLPGLVFSCGTSVEADIYPVKNTNDTKWETLSYIDGFEYEPGYEYIVKISKTSYLDWRMGSPSWTEYELLEIVSKEKKDSENLPEHFIPDWWTERD